MSQQSAYDTALLMRRCDQNLRQNNLRFLLPLTLSPLLPHVHILSVSLLCRGSGHGGTTASDHIT